MIADSIQFLAGVHSTFLCQEVQESQVFVGNWRKTSLNNLSTKGIYWPKFVCLVDLTGSLDRRSEQKKGSDQGYSPTNMLRDYSQFIMEQVLEWTPALSFIFLSKTLNTLVTLGKVGQGTVMHLLTDTAQHRETIS